MEAVKVLVGNGADLKAKSGKEESGNTPVHLAVLRGCSHVVQYITEFDLSTLNLLNSRGQNANSFIETTPVVRQALHNEMNMAYFSAAESGDLATLRVIVKNGVQVNVTTPHYQGSDSVLHLAAKNDHLPVVEYLASFHSELLNMTNKDGDFAIHVAGRQGNIKIVHFFLRHGVDPNIRNTLNGNTVFLSSAEGGNLPMIDSLIERQLSVRGRNLAGENALHVCARMGHDKMIDYFLDRRLFHIESKNRKKQSALSIASEHGKIAVAHNLVRRRATYESVDDTGFTPILHACEKGHKEVYLFLLEKGADPRVKTKIDGNECAHLAVISGNSDLLVEVIRRQGRDESLDAKNKYGETPLWLAVYMGNEKMAGLLVVNSQVHLDTRCNSGFTPFLVSVLRNRLNIMKRLLNEYGADLRDSTLEGDFPIHVAATHGHKDMLTEFINIYGDTEIMNSKGQTPLWRACSVGTLESVELLLGRGANIRYYFEIVS